jgi:hypothetical protein
MFCQLGNIVFEPLTGFDSVSKSGAAVIAQYQLLTGVPKPDQTGRELRTMNLGMKLHQRFIIVKNAIAQILANIDNATPCALVWGNGDNEGLWLVQNYTIDALEMDPYGNMFYANVTVGLLEVPSDGLLAAKQDSAVKQAFGLTDTAVPVINPPAPYQPKQWQVWLGYFNSAKKWANRINSLVYSGITPLVSDILSGHLANATTELQLMGMQYSSWGEGFADMQDLTTNISDVQSALSALSVIDPILDFAGFSAAHTIFQSKMVVLIRNSFQLQARSVCRMSNLITGN